MNDLNKLIALAINEDIGHGDITTDAIIPSNQSGVAYLIAKMDFILAGVNIAQLVFEKLDTTVEFKPYFQDGSHVQASDKIAQCKGPLRSLLKGERLALNFMQRLSGIATMTHDYVQCLASDRVKIVDTRKTTPGWRSLEKYAVKIGGGHNHRMGLFDGILIKDNHIAVCGSIQQAIKLARQNNHHLVKVEIEVDHLTQIPDALEAGADIILLDNMSIEQIKQAVQIINGKAIIEVSGGVQKEHIHALSQTGIDIISIGALTHSAKAVDISMEITTIP